MDNKQIFETLKNYMIKEGAIEIKIFGSYVSGEHDKNSDIDILVEFKNILGTIGFVNKFCI